VRTARQQGGQPYKDIESDLRATINLEQLHYPRKSDILISGGEVVIIREIPQPDIASSTGPAKGQIGDGGEVE